MQVLATVSPTSPLSVLPTERNSVIPLPVGQADRLGLTLPPDLKYDDWVEVGRRVSELSKAATWLLGDWLAYGVHTYGTSHWNGRVPHELYERLSLETGYAEQTLQNARCVCQKIPRSRRREHVSFSHAVEIAGRVQDPDDIEGWLDFVAGGGVTVKALRERLREANREALPEHGDTGVTSFLETARQFSRDYSAAQPRMTPTLRAELRKVLGPVLRDLA
jgi:hypothetical protein